MKQDLFQMLLTLYQMPRQMETSGSRFPFPLELSGGCMLY